MEKIINWHFENGQVSIPEYTNEYINVILKKYKNKPNHDELANIAANMDGCMRYNNEFNIEQKEMFELFLKFGWQSQGIYQYIHSIDNEKAKEIFHSIFRLKSCY